MSKLSELLPAGGGGKQVDFVASGVLPNGKPVILKANGQVEVVATSGSAFTKGSAVVFDTQDPTEGLSVVYDSSNNKIVVIYSDSGNSSYGTAVVGTVSGTSISFGTAVVFNSGNTQKIGAVFDSNLNKVIPVWDQVSGSSLRAIVGTVSGTSISFGSSTTFSNDDSSTIIRATFDSNSNKVIFAYGDDGNSNYGSAIVGTVSGTSISFGSVTVFENFQSENIGMTFDSNLNKVVIGFQRSNKGYGIVGTVSGTGISFGTKVLTDGSNNARYFALTFDTTSNKVVFGYTSVPRAEAVAAVVGTVSGITISFGTPVILISGASTNYRVTGATYDSTANKVCFSVRREQNNFIDITSASVSGTTLVSITDDSLGVPTFTFAPIVYDPDTNTVVCTYQDNGNSKRGTAMVSTTNTISTNLTSTNFIGITDAAIASGATGSVTVKGGVAAGLAGGTFAVTVANAGSGNRYYINGVLQQTLNLREGFTYKFDQSASSNSGHPFRFSTTANGTHAGGSEYTTGVTTSGTPGNAGAYTQIVVAASAPTLYYYCTNHSLMGGQANTLAAFVPNSVYYVQADGAISTVSTSPAVNIGKAISATSLILKG